MKIASICFIALTATVSVTFGAPNLIKTDLINEAVTQLECASDAILPIDKKYGLGALWLPVYFPIVMHTNNLYECQDENTQEYSDECVSDEMQSAISTLVDFVSNVRENNTDASDEILNVMIDTCGIAMPQSDEIYDANVDLQKINFHKIHENIKHLKCVAVAIGTAIGDSGLALEWISYNIELKNCIARIVACSKHTSVQQKLCMVDELRPTIKVLLKLWKFLSEKKHLEVFGQIKGEISKQCYSHSFPLLAW